MTTLFLPNDGEPPNSGVIRIAVRAIRFPPAIPEPNQSYAGRSRPAIAKKIQRLYASFSPRKRLANSELSTPD
jgi:hypothetical protein